jgi:hypothetical protein
MSGQAPIPPGYEEYEDEFDPGPRPIHQRDDLPPLVARHFPHIIPALDHSFPAKGQPGPALNFLGVLVAVVGAGLGVYFLVLLMSPGIGQVLPVFSLTGLALFAFLVLLPTGVATYMALLTTQEIRRPAFEMVRLSPLRDWQLAAGFLYLGWWRVQPLLMPALAFLALISGLCTCAAALADPLIAVFVLFVVPLQMGGLLLAGMCIGLAGALHYPRPVTLAIFVPLGVMGLALLSETTTLVLLDDTVFLLINQSLSDAIEYSDVYDTGSPPDVQPGSFILGISLLLAPYLLAGMAFLVGLAGVRRSHRPSVL